MKSAKALAAQGLLLTAGMIFLFSSISAYAQDTSWLSAASTKPVKFDVNGKDSSSMNITAVVASDTECNNSRPDQRDGQFTCRKMISDGSTITVVRDQENHGRHFKRQTRMFHRSESGSLLGRKTVRHKIKYRSHEGKRTKEAEYFDIVDRPADGRTTREFVVFKYEGKDEKLAYASWTLYHRIGDTSFAQLANHVSLDYVHGTPSKGRAEIWQEGVKISEPFRWDSERPELGSLDRTIWRAWQDRIAEASRQGLSF
jgi:hypothetical protein